MIDWTWRDHVAYYIHKVGYLFSKPIEHDILVRDADGREIFSIAFVDGFVAEGPIEPYTLHCRHYANDADEIGVVEDI